MKRLSLVLLVASLTGSALLVGSARASSTTACWSRVINDWYDNGRIDKTYPVACYREALGHLPQDVLQYADAKDVITRAMAAEVAVIGKESRRQHANGGPDSTDPGSTSTNPGSVPPGGSSGGGNGTPPGSAQSHSDPLLKRAITRLGPSNANSLPLPLVVLGALALLLLAAGAAGVVARKLQERHLPATPAGSPPPDAPPAS